MGEWFCCNTLSQEKPKKKGEEGTFVQPWVAAVGFAAVQGSELDLEIPVGPFQLSSFCDLRDGAAVWGALCVHEIKVHTASSIFLWFF